MLRGTSLWLSEQPAVFAVALALNEKGITVSLDLLGESVSIETETWRARRERQMSADRFELQMLYGVRRDLQETLRAQGFTLRVYVPFGTAWYRYLMRRLAERPGNLGFMVGNVAREPRR